MLILFRVTRMRLSFAKLCKIGLVLCLPLLAAACQHSSVTTTGSLSAPYVLGPGDKVRVLVFGQPDLSNSFSVSAGGQISYPLVGTIEAEGRTLAELEGVIRASLMEGYLRDPQVAVEIESYRPVFIHGSVGQAGSYSWREGLTAERAIALAGGFSARASKRSVSVSRYVDGELHKARVPLNFAIFPGDTLEVHERLF
jgi:polysaccharide export outer membrane protein